MTPMPHPSSEQLSDYLDEELIPAARAEVHAHLASCTDCAALLAELRRVISRAQALDDSPPQADLWPGVAAAIGATPAGRRPSFSWPQLVAAGIALVVLSGGTVALLLNGGASFTGVGRRPTAQSHGASTVVPAGAPSVAGRGYDAAIRELEAELRSGRGRLDSTTVRVVTQKLQLIDRAIAEAERALATDSASTYLHGHLAQTRLRKLDLLRQAAALTRAVS
jgi:hypothetical protein